MIIRWTGLFLFLTLVAVGAGAWQQNQPAAVKPIPPPGIEVSAADRAELEAGIAALGKEIEALRVTLKDRPALLDLLPDVQIYHNAARYALAYNEFFKPEEIAVAKAQLRQGMERARALREGKAPWTEETGLVARGYVSEIDGSVQPYGLVVPASYQSNSPSRHRLDVWFHGRGETLSEVSFINDRQKNPGQFTPPDAFVLHPYGRYCNANKFAGEVDLFEALAHARRHYPIDENRISVRGFSMGGAACWQFATHFAAMWAAAAPGAGFAETADFLRVFADEALKPTWYEQKLWHLYDATDYAANLFNCPTVAYSGENDRQKQAADVMAKAMKAEGLELVHIIGPKTEHRYHPDSIKEINRRIDSIVARGRNPVPREVRFTTWTLRYNRMLWVTVDAMEQHWERARVDAAIRDASAVQVKTQNVSALTLEMPSGLCPLDNTRQPTVAIDDQKIIAPAVMSDRSWTAHFRRMGKTWVAVASVDDGELRKRHGLQGPIDDAFMSSFMMVLPTGKAMNETIGAWVASEQAHAIRHWRQQFRGEARVKNDEAVTDEDIASHNLILWGDPGSNKILARIADKLPIRWDTRGIRVGSQSFPAAQHVPVFIYPNPLNPKRYIVINSGFTYREYDYLNNARQVPKLPDYAVVDVSVPPSARSVGGIVLAGFFGERWELLIPAARP
ncbi:MAG TPA: prolyl oligopeptidase family serine peptidase [Blastocatellia bacterium]|nr:prolyl oligopeptidase family serine peptidase [Blastocatellia bacterium]